MDNLSNNASKTMTADLIESMMKTLLEQQLNHQKNGKYVEAQNCKKQYQESKKNLDKRRLYQMEMNHKKQISDIDHAHKQQLNHFNKFWDQKLHDFTTEADKLEKELQAKHNSEIQKLKADLDKQLPLKLKESSQLLNLRKMQDHMAKQKNYLQAHKVQTKANAMFESETAAWIQMRNNKIATAVQNLKVKQNAEMAAFKKRMSTGADQLNRQRHFQQIRLQQKYDNICKDLKSQQEKEVLFFKGEFRSKGAQSGQSSPNIKSKNAI